MPRRRMPRRRMPRRRMPLRLLLAAAVLLTGGAAAEKTILPLELCSAEQFKAAMEHLLDPQAKLLTWADKAGLVARYAKVSQVQRCATVPSVKWPISKVNAAKTMIINVGEGSTGTRFLNCVMRRLGLNGAHTRGDHDMSTGKAKNRSKEIEFLGCEHYPSCTDGWDQFSYISDSPVPYFVRELLATHPSALVIQSLRSPSSWVHSRIKKHKLQGAENWHQATVCGDADHPMKHNLTEMDFVVYNIFAKCISPGGGRSMEFNMFKENSAIILRRLLEFLAHNNVALTPHLPPTVTGNDAVAEHVESVCKAEATGKFKKQTTDPRANAKAFRAKRPAIRASLGKLAEAMCIDTPKVGGSCGMFLPAIGFGRGKPLFTPNAPPRPVQQRETLAHGTASAHAFLLSAARLAVVAGGTGRTARSRVSTCSPPVSNISINAICVCVCVWVVVVVVGGVVCTRPCRPQRHTD